MTWDGWLRPEPPDVPPLPGSLDRPGVLGPATPGSPAPSRSRSSPRPRDRCSTPAAATSPPPRGPPVKRVSNRRVITAGGSGRGPLGPGHSASTSQAGPCSGPWTGWRPRAGWPGAARSPCRRRGLGGTPMILDAVGGHGQTEAAGHQTARPAGWAARRGRTGGPAAPSKPNSASDGCPCCVRPANANPNGPAPGTAHRCARPSRRSTTPSTASSTSNTTGAAPSLA